MLILQGDFLAAIDHAGACWKVLQITIALGRDHIVLRLDHMGRGIKGGADLVAIGV